MLTRLKQLLSRIDADYVDIRHETKTETAIAFSGAELTEIGSNTTDGFVLRLLKNGGFSAVSVTREDQLDRALETAQRNARLLATRTDKKVSLAATAVVRDAIKPQLTEDPRQISLDEKLALTQRYNQIPLCEEKVITTAISYTEVIREKTLVTSEGTEIQEELVTSRIGGGITTGDGTSLQSVRVGVGGSTGFGLLRNVDEQFEIKTRIALDLLQAKPVTAGSYNVILNPSLAGVFTHEAFGHFSEADLIEDAPSMRARMQIGAMLGTEILSIKDDPTLPDQLGHYRYDDEGVAARPVQLMQNGVLRGRLHSRRTAAAFGEPISGHCVAEDYRYAPIIRMGTIFIEPGAHSLDDLLQQLDNGLYVLDAMGGQTSGENFTFGAQYGYEVKNGSIQGMVRDINISGNLYSTLQSIQSVGDQVVLSKIGGCGKGQTNIRSCHGAPPILVNNVVLGGV